MSLNKLLVLKSFSDISANNALLVLAKPTIIGSGVNQKARINLNVFSPFINWAVNVTRRYYDPEVGNRMTQIRFPDILATGSDVDERNSLAKVINIDIPVALVGTGPVELEFVPLDGHVDFSFGDGLYKTQAVFLSREFESIYSLPEHPLLSGIRFNSTHYAVTGNLVSVTANFPDSYNTMYRMFAMHSKLTYFPLSFGHDNIISFESAFENCTLLANGSIRFDGGKNLTHPSCERMFAGCESITRSFVNGMRRILSRNYSKMFFACSNLVNLPPDFLHDPNDLSTVVATDFSSMFHSAIKYTGAGLLTLPAANELINFNNMYDGCVEFNGSGFSNYQHRGASADRMFYGCFKFTGMIAGSNVKEQIRLRIMSGTGIGVFDGCSVFNGDLSALFNDANLTGTINNTVFGMFRNCKLLEFTGLGEGGRVNIAGLSVSQMFEGTTAAIAADLRQFTFRNTITSATRMFYNSGYGGIGMSADNWQFQNLLNAESMFDGCSKLEFGNSSLSQPEFFKSVVAPNKVIARYMFRGCTKAVFNFPHMIYTRRISDATSMFSGCKGITDQPFTSSSKKFDFDVLESAASMFEGCSNMIGVGLNDSLVKIAPRNGATGRIGVDFQRMYFGCNVLLEYMHMHLLTVSSTAASTSFIVDSMFYSCEKLSFADLNLKFRVTPKGLYITLNNTFYNCRSMVDLPKIDFLDGQIITNMTQTFQMCELIENIRLDNFVLEPDYGSTFFCGNAFDGCEKYRGNGLVALLRTLPVGVFCRAYGMFYGCTAFDLDFEGIPLTLVGNASNLFVNCANFRGTGIQNFNLAEVTSLISVFQGCSELSNVIFTESWHAPKATEASYMFYCATKFNGAGVQHLFKNVSAVTSLARFAVNTLNWTQPLTTWCVSKIPSPPPDFAAPGHFLSNPANQPVWGTCPVVP